MAKNKENTTSTVNKELANMTRAQLHARRLANVAERKRLSEENVVLVELWKKAGKQKPAKTETKPTAKPVTKAKKK